MSTPVIDPCGYPPALHGYLTRKLQNREDASDLAQQAYLQYLQYCKRKSRGDILRHDHYIFRIAMRLLSQWRQQRLRAEAVAVEISRLNEPVEEDLGEAQEQEEISDERLQKVLDAIPLNYRRVLWLMKVEEMSYLEVAQKLRLAPDTVMTYLARAMDAARRAQRSFEESGWHDEIHIK